ncbi:ATP-binding protein [Roseospirillum parvum]|uniref:Serine/threonine-protein kinase RsbW/sigma-B regulation protein RsbU (Phosphoserine phosphatase) n=1 Tax=Roseospirillum parvum TaxID=83401 RepID=A0A1G8CIU0_9PROT|nr:ATP-binding protein [Roseospirillum parvum]SDH45401.1 serine/threonine-protein kinase RsbW/sigma-B regulation protein RsbU (phosphoserine phosphatase) [Roseospirillum parvum]
MIPPVPPRTTSGHLLWRGRVAARAANLADIRRAVAGALEGLPAGPDWRHDLVLAVDEACQNIVRHAYGGKETGDIVIEMAWKDDTVIVTLVDFADPVDPHCLVIRDPAEVRPGGLGLHLIREVTDRAEFLSPPAGAGNLLRLIKRFDREGG